MNGRARPVRLVTARPGWVRDLIQPSCAIVDADELDLQVWKLVAHKLLAQQRLVCDHRRHLGCNGPDRQYLCHGTARTLSAILPFMLPSSIDLQQKWSSRRQLLERGHSGLASLPKPIFLSVTAAAIFPSAWTTAIQNQPFG
jgi:hypothetical protein